MDGDILVPSSSFHNQSGNKLTGISAKFLQVRWCDFYLDPGNRPIGEKLLAWALCSCICSGWVTATGESCQGNPSRGHSQANQVSRCLCHETQCTTGLFFTRTSALALGLSSPSLGLFLTAPRAHKVAEPPPSKFKASEHPSLIR